MANAITWSDLGTLQTYLSTELDALADAGRKLGAEIDNTSDKSTYMIVELYIAVQGVARDSGAYVSLYLLKSTDGVNYDFGSDALDPPSGSWVNNFTLDADTAARYVSIEVAIPPSKFKLMVINNTGQALAAANNTLKYRTYSLEVQ
jgi:hypothetical protein